MNWNIFALANPKTNKFGQVKEITGLNWFMSVNYMRVLQGQAVLNNPPTYTLPHATGPWGIDYDSTHITLIGLNLFNYKIPVTSVWTSLPTTRMKSSVNQIRKYVETIGSNPGTPYDITATWQPATQLTWTNAFAANNVRVWIS